MIVILAKYEIMHENLDLKVFRTKNMDADISVLIALMLNQ
jgi:hypothetical protein